MKFFKYGVDIFDRKYKRFGGHTHWLAHSYLFDNRWYCIDYLIIELKFRLHKWERFSTYYDGYHHSLHFLFLTICWGGCPYKETPVKSKAEIRKEKIEKLL